MSEARLLSSVMQAARTIARLSRLLEIALAETALSRGEYILLAALGAGVSSASEVAERSSVTQANISALVTAMVGKGLVVQTPDAQDSRRKHLHLTEQGRAKLATADQVCAAELAELALVFAEPGADVAGTFAAVGQLGAALDRLMVARTKLPASKTLSVREISALLRADDNAA